MRITRVFIMLATCLLFVYACKMNNPGNVVGPVPSGAWVYMSYDSVGTAIVQGWFTLVITDSSQVTGEWHFAQIGQPKNIGPQVGDGNLVGGFELGLLWLELNPQYKDNNLQLRGKFDGTHYSGAWCAIGYSGIMNRGTFRATKK